MRGKKIKDHLGIEYDSVDALCKKYNISKATYFQRLNRGMSLQAALTTPISYKKTVSDVEDYPLALALRNYRIKNNLTQKELADKFNDFIISNHYANSKKSLSSITAWESGYRSPSSSDLLIIAEFLNTPVENLIRRKKILSVYL